MFRYYSKIHRRWQSRVDNSPSSIDNGRVKNYLRPGIPILLAIILIMERLLFPERALTATGGRALADAFFSLGLLTLTLAVAMGTGSRVLRRFQLGLSPLETMVFGVPLGLGVAAYGVLAVGLLGGLNAPVLTGWFIVLMIFSWGEWQWLVADLSARTIRHHWRKWHIGQKTVFGAVGVIFGLSIFQAFTPPWNYDGLMYHLTAPKLFLQAGRITFQPQVWPANYPLATEMLYTLGLAFGSDTFARLIHLTLAAWLVLATFFAGRRWLGNSGGWLAATILLGIPMLPIWGSLSYADMGWSLWGFLAVLTALRRGETDNRRWLALAGVMAGFAIGSKYLALGLMFPVGMWVLWRARHNGWRQVLADGVLFGGVALAVASPWYLKNWLWTGNPIFPLVWGGADWDTVRLQLLAEHHRIYGTGRSWLDYLLLPVHLYTQYSRFTTFLGNTEIAGLLFPVLIFYPFARKKYLLNSLLAIVGGQFIFWAIGPQHVRFLLPLFPAFSVLTAHVLSDISVRVMRPSLGKIVVAGLTGGTLMATLLYAVIWFADVRPLRVVIGHISKSDFLTERVEPFAAEQFIQQTLPPSARVLQLWDARGYYCDARCVPDIEPSLWTRVAVTEPTVGAAATSLRARGISHVMLNRTDTEFLAPSDARARQFLLNAFLPACGREIFADTDEQIFEIVCQ